MVDPEVKANYTQSLKDMRDIARECGDNLAAGMLGTIIGAREEGQKAEDELGLVMMVWTQARVAGVIRKE